jgi:GNAT superfamily N-acetyltransferase
MTVSTDLFVRPSTDDDLPAVLDLVRNSLGWSPDDPDELLFHWKHHENPFGRSPAWVALAGERLVGFRTLMRWEFVAGDGTIKAVRAVDTVTAPDFRGRGIFSLLTKTALAEMEAEGVDLVFNTPNDQSRQGYLKLGWQVVGRLPTGMRPASLRSLMRTGRSRVPAELWSHHCEVGVSPAEAFADDTAVDDLLGAVSAGGGASCLRTRRTAPYLRWRYGLAPLHYRVLTLGSDLGDGCVVFRLRRRGSSVEAAIVEILVPRPSPLRRLVRDVLRLTGADHAVAIGHGWRDGLIPLRGQGPLLTARALRSTPPASGDWALELGDIELF